MDLQTLVTSIVILASSYSAIAFFQHRKRSRNHPFPPGPEGYPFVGNILSMFQGQRWKIFSDYKSQYGDVVRLHGFGTNLFALNSLDTIDDLLGKRGHIYSHRPKFTVVGEMMGLESSTPLLSYGPEWRLHRKLAHNVLSITSVKQYYGLQEDLAIMLCDELIKTPEKFFSSARLFASRLMLTITYGLSAKTADNMYVEHAHKTMNMVSQSSTPGAFMADFLPFLKHLPLPFQKDVKVGADMLDKLVRLPFEHVKRELAAGTALPSLTKDLLTTSDSSIEHQIKWTTGSMYGAGGESTYATISTFILCMALYPETQRKAQKEIETVIGKGRLPVISDMADLPYVNAMIKETMRWHPIVPLTLARRVAEDDFYKGFFIPKGSLVIPNAWAIALEPNSKYEPSEFIPERFLDDEVKTTDPALWAFGFGRRICPGKHLAENSLFIAISMILTAFDISKGNHDLVPAFEEDLIRYLIFEFGIRDRAILITVYPSYPKPFKCSIVPRNEVITNLITQRAAEAYV